ncbi:hypothetical protein SeMB42_g02898 [Synchytrium endobioticum]|uniref:Uncharacterized protein n=1 Tax=Synchytrium endobioticum TaxID=286115 RepID=A0A507DAF1_9FUNG|nr:hypothetical protein SeMB42_g02898 [Synchytrium endobioticum]
MERLANALHPDREAVINSVELMDRIAPIEGILSATPDRGFSLAELKFLQEYHRLLYWCFTRDLVWISAAEEQICCLGLLGEELPPTTLERLERFRALTIHHARMVNEFESAKSELGQIPAQDRGSDRNGRQAWRRLGDSSGSLMARRSSPDNGGHIRGSINRG